MKKKLLLSSILSIVMCFSLICGATFALFTSEDKVNIAVTSGTVSVNAVVEDLEYKTYTKDWTAANVNDTILFDNLGGKATVAGGKITLDKIVAGDGIKFNISVDNESNVTAKYRAVIKNVGSDADLFNALDIVVNGDAFKGVTATKWAELAANTDVPDLVSVSIVLPDEADDTDEVKIMGKTCQIEVLIQAIQGNAETSDTIEVTNASELVSAITSGENVTLKNNLEITQDIEIPAGAESTVDLNGKIISVKSTASVSLLSATAYEENVNIKYAIIYNNGTLSLKNGTIIAEEVTAIRNHGSAAKLTLENMTIIQKVATDPEWLGSAIFTSGGATTEIKSGNYTGISSAAIIATSGGNLIIEDGTFTADVTTIRADSWSYNNKLTINNGTFNVSKDGAKALCVDGYQTAEDMNINGGVFNGTLDSTYTNITINGGTFNKSIKQPGGHQNYYIINGGTFVDDLRTSISKNTVVNNNVIDNENGTYTVANVADIIAVGGEINIGGIVDFNNATIAIPNGATFIGGTIKNARLTLADDYIASFKNVKFAGATTVEAQGDGDLRFNGCEFNVAPKKYNGFSRAAAIIGANQYYTLNLNIEDCVFNYNAGGDDVFASAIFMWSSVDSCVIKNCEFNGYGFMAVKLMNAVENAEIIFEGNTFAMAKEGDSNNYYNNAVQVMPQHDNAITLKFIDNAFTGDYEDGKIVAYIEVMNGGTLTKLTFEQSDNTLNGETVTNDNFAINAA